MRYEKYSAEDFVQDEYFQKWVTAPDEAAEAFWQAWLKEHPEKTATVEEARRIIVLLNFDTDHAANRRFLQVWQKLDTHWEKQAPKTTAATSVFKTWHKVAAAVTGLLLISAVYFFLTNTSTTVTYATTYGETQTILLPDSSSVTLNANSVLTLSKVWTETKPREVHLSGEAFFEVRKTAQAGNAKFIVHTDNLKVEVLGTQFNVNNRRNKTQVVLNSGKIRLDTDETSAIDNMIMKPGDLVEFSQAGGPLTVKQVNPAIYSSWKHNELIFEDTPVAEIIQILEDTYGLQIRVESRSLLNKKYTGTFKGANKEIILESLSTLFGLEIEQGNGAIILKDSKDM